MISLRLAHREESCEFQACMQAAYDNLDNKDWYVCDDCEYVKFVLSSTTNGFGVVAEELCDNYDDGASLQFERRPFAGVLLVTFPHDSDDNLLRDIERNIYGGQGSISSDNKENTALRLESAAHIESLAVNPCFQGKGIGKQMISYACSYISNNYSGIRYICSTVSPDNTASLSAFIKSGFNIELTKQKYGGKLRHILMKTDF